jgi:hypothetical protein
MISFVRKNDEVRSKPTNSEDFFFEIVVNQLIDEYIDECKTYYYRC